MAGERGTSWAIGPAAAVLRRAGSRGAAWALAGLALGELLWALCCDGVGGRRPWIDLSPLPRGAREVALAVGVGWLLWGLVRPPRAGRLRQTMGWGLAVMAAAILVRSGEFYVRLARGELRAVLPVPFSLVAAVLVAGQAWWAPRRRPRSRPLWRCALQEALGASGALAGMVLAQILLFGGVSQERAADAVVVFGARVYADGTPSLALSDRVWTACDLYRRKLAPVVVLSGGPGDGRLTEPEAMKLLAMEAGVPEQALVMDEAGVNTRASIVNLRRLMGERGWGSVLAVSHYYHLSRIDLCCRREGVLAFTMAARQTRRLRREPYSVAREVPAWLLYFVRWAWAEKGCRGDRLPGRRPGPSVAFDFRGPRL